MREWKYISIIIELSGQLRATAASLPGKEPPVPIVKEVE
jgi:hypothetical protein